MLSSLRRCALTAAAVLGLGTGLQAEDYGQSTLLPGSSYSSTSPQSYKYNHWGAKNYAASFSVQGKAKAPQPPIPPAPMLPSSKQPAKKVPMPLAKTPMPQAPPMGQQPMDTPPMKTSPMGNPMPPLQPMETPSPSPSDVPAPEPTPQGKNTFMSDGYYGGGCNDSCCGFSPGWGGFMGLGGCRTGSCGAGCCGISCACCPWFGGVGGTVMGRDNPNHVCYSFNSAAASQVLLSNTDANQDWGGGVEARFGRYLNSCRSMWVEVVYWGAYPNTAEANAFDPDGVQSSGQDLNSALSFQSLDYNGLGNPIANLFDNAARHRLLRSSEWHNVEINLFGNACGPCASDCGPSFRWYGGLRYFKFKDGFQYWSDDTDTTFTGAVDEVYYAVDADNNLVGFQLGGFVDYRVGCSWNLYAGTKVGVYGNYMEHSSFVGGASGAAVINDGANPYNSSTFDINSSKTDVAFVGEIDMGVEYQFLSCWSARIGYRAVGLTGVALADNQIPSNFGDYEGTARIDSNGSLILHGGYASILFNY